MQRELALWGKVTLELRNRGPWLRGYMSQSTTGSDLRVVSSSWLNNPISAMEGAPAPSTSIQERNPSCEFFLRKEGPSPVGLLMTEIASFSPFHPPKEAYLA